MNQSSNPYETSGKPLTAVSMRKFVLAYAIAAAICATLFLVSSVPAAILLNQKYQWIPTNTFLSTIEFNGRVFEIATILTFSVVVSLIHFGLCTLFVSIAIRNHFLNSGFSGHH
jgi:hypothetical protein